MLNGIKAIRTGNSNTKPAYAKIYGSLTTVLEEDEETEYPFIVVFGFWRDLTIKDVNSLIWNLKVTI